VPGNHPAELRSGAAPSADPNDELPRKVHFEKKFYQIAGHPREHIHPRVDLFDADGAHRAASAKPRPTTLTPRYRIVNHFRPTFHFWRLSSTNVSCSWSKETLNTAEKSFRCSHFTLPQQNRVRWQLMGA
jgi:hypothetical protein